MRVVPGAMGQSNHFGCGLCDAGSATIDTIQHQSVPALPIHVAEVSRVDLDLGRVLWCRGSENNQPTQKPEHYILP